MQYFAKNLRLIHQVRLIHRLVARKVTDIGSMDRWGTKLVVVAFEVFLVYTKYIHEQLYNIRNVVRIYLF